MKDNGHKINLMGMEDVYIMTENIMSAIGKMGNIMDRESWLAKNLHMKENGIKIKRYIYCVYLSMVMELKIE